MASLTAVLLVSSAAFADDGKDWHHLSSLSPYATYQFDSAYGESQVHISRVGVDFDNSFSLTPDLRMNADTRIEDSVYDFNDFRHESAGTKTPVDHVVLLRFVPGLTYTINPDWTVRGGLIFQDSGQTGASWGDSFTWGTYAMVIHPISKTLTVGGGLVVYSQLEDSIGILPLFYFDWNFSNQWHFTGHETELRISYYTRPDLSYYFAGSYNTREYRLEEDNHFDPGGVLNDDMIPVRLGVQWQPSPQFKISGEVGAVAWQKLTFEDDRGDKVLEDNVDPTFFIAMQFTYSF